MRPLDFEVPLAEIREQIEMLRCSTEGSVADREKEIRLLQEKLDKLVKQTYQGLTPWQRTQLARHEDRPYAMDIISALFTDFVEIHGDRLYAEDPALVAGTGWFGEDPFYIVGQQKGRGTKEKIRCNFGMLQPEGYRKAMRVMRLAEKFSRPLICFIDTPGAFPGIGAEERGQAEAIAKNLKVMSALQTPIICIVLGEGGSGGALGIGLGDRILMLENAIYSVISPEGCAAILFRDSSRADEAAQSLCLTAPDLKKFNIVDDIIPESGGAHTDHDAAASNIGKALRRHWDELKDEPIDQLLEKRWLKFRLLGPYDSRENCNW